MPYAKGFELIATVTGLDLASTSTLARTTRAHGARARALIAAEHAAHAAPGPVPGATDSAEGPDLCYIVLDGTGAPMLPRECADRPGKHPDGKAGTREVKIGCFFTQTSRNPDTGDPVQDVGSASYISTFEPAATFAVHVKAEYHRRGFDQIRQPLVLGDGAKWIWTIADQHLPQATQIVDYYHAREHLADLTTTLAPVLTDPPAFEQALIDHLDLGDTPAIAAAVDALDLPQTVPDLDQTRRHRGRLLHRQPPPHAIRRLPRQRLLHRLRPRRISLQHHRQTTRQTRRHALDHPRTRPRPRPTNPAPIQTRPHPLAPTTNLTHTLQKPLRAGLSVVGCRVDDVSTVVPPAPHVPVLPGLDDEPAGQRPMPPVRAPGELVAATRALAREIHDVRYRGLAEGATAALDWTTGLTHTSPLRGLSVRGPSLVEVVEEYGRAVLVSAGAQPWPGRAWSDFTRVQAHGIELVLAWYAFADVATPAVLEPGASVREVFAGLGDVGFDDVGLHGPGVSRLRFPPVPGARFTVEGTAEGGRLVICRSPRPGRLG